MRAALRTASPGAGLARYGSSSYCPVGQTITPADGPAIRDAHNHRVRRLATEGILTPNHRTWVGPR